MCAFMYLGGKSNHTSKVNENHHKTKQKIVA